MVRNIMIGKQGEKAVKKLLENRGYRILETNFRTRFGEIDIIAERSDTLVFVEVKTRTGVSFGIPEEAVHPQKQERIRRVAVEYLSTMGSKFYKEVRFDVAAIFAGKDGKPKTIRIHEGAF